MGPLTDVSRKAFEVTVDRIHRKIDRLTEKGARVSSELSRMALRQRDLEDRLSKLEE